MKTYDLYLHSGPMLKKTYIHVPSLMGCIAQGDTTDLALAAAPEALHGYLRFLANYGERVSPTAAFRTNIAQHDRRGGFLGSGFLPTDSAPISKRESEAMMRRLAAIHEGLRNLTQGLTTKDLGRQPPRGRSIKRILAHICAEGGYLRGVSGASRIQRDVEEGRLDPHEALDQLLILEQERLDSMDDSERTAVIMRGQTPWSVRAAVRRMLEHAWEHHVEIAERLGRSR
jgi:predicted RNase H-like HicB family nuclease